MELTELIAGCQAYKRRSQQKLVAHIAPRLKSICMRYLDEEFEVEEALQESLISILRSIQDFNPELGSFRAWTKRIVINTIFSRLRKQYRQAAREASAPVFETTVEPQGYQDLLAEDLLQILQTLPTGYRNVLCLYAIDGYSHREISEMLGISESTSRSQLTRARDLFRRRLQFYQNINPCKEIQ